MIGTLRGAVRRRSSATAAGWPKGCTTTTARVVSLRTRASPRGESPPDSASTSTGTGASPAATTRSAQPSAKRSGSATSPGSPAPPPVAAASAASRASARVDQSRIRAGVGVEVRRDARGTARHRDPGRRGREAWGRGARGPCGRACRRRWPAAASDRRSPGESTRGDPRRAKAPGGAGRRPWGTLAGDRPSSSDAGAPSRAGTSSAGRTARTPASASSDRRGMSRLPFS